MSTQIAGCFKSCLHLVSSLPTCSCCCSRVISAMRVSLVWLVCSTSLRWADSLNRTSCSFPSSWDFLSFCEYDDQRNHDQMIKNPVIKYVCTVWFKLAVFLTYVPLGQCLPANASDVPDQYSSRFPSELISYLSHSASLVVLIMLLKTDYAEDYLFFWSQIYGSATTYIIFTN